MKGDYAEGHIFKNIKFPEKDPEIRRLVHELVNDAFFADLARLGRAEGAVLLLDSYRGKEGMPEAHTWLKVQLLRRIGEGELPGVRVVIAGETYPPLESAGHAPVAELSLDPLPAAEVRRYLACRRPTISEASVTRIYEVTGGQPDQVALIADFEGELPEQLDPDKLHEIMVLGILEDKEGPMAETLRVAAIPEWFDDELLADLLDKRSVEGKRPQDLQVYSFVQEFEGGRFRFAPKVRHVLLRSWEMEDRPDLGALHECAAHHFDERAGQALSDRQRWEFQRQAAAHWLERDERTGLERVRALFEEAEPSYELSECQLLLARASDVEGLQAVTEAWLQYLAGRLALARNEFDKSSDLLGSALDEREADAELVALTNFCLGQLAAEQGHWDTAIDKYERSRPFFAGHQHSVWEGKVMLALGDVHLQQARALGGPLQPSLLQGKKGWRIIKALPALLVALPFVVFARLIQHWRLPLRHGMNYRNWTLARLLLTAQHWFSEALSRFESAGPEELVPDAQLRLAQTYYRLGWRDDARQLFKQALDDFRENNKAYRIAGVLRESAEMELRAANSGDTIEKAIKDLEESLQTFEDYGDIQSQAQVRALLGYAWLEKGEFERGLDLLQASLDGFSSIGDRLGIGYALHIMRSWMQYAEPPPERAERVKRVIARARIKAYLPRVPDRLAAAMELGASAGLIMLALVGAVLLGLGVLTPVPEIFAYLLSAGTVLKLLGLLILAILAFFLVFSGIGLVLIVWGSRQRLKPERLDRVVTTDNAISRVPYMGDEETRLDWRDAKTTVSVDRMLWRTPLPLLSDFWLFGQATEIQVPATTGWYGELRRDIEDHLQDQSVRPIRRGLDLHVFRNWLGLGFALSPVLVALGAALIWNQIVLPLPLELTAWLGIAAMFLGVMGLIAGPYWWLVLHPLWVRYHLAPRLWVPVVAGAIGAGIVAFAFFFRQWQPFYPIRNWLEWTVHPLGYVLLIVAALWVVTARDRARLFAGRGKAAYAMWQRGIATVLLAGAVGLAALFLRAEWVPYLPVFRAVAYYYHGEYELTIRTSSQALAINANMADGYYLRAAASIELERYEPAVYDLSQMIDSGSAINADYYLFRARAYQGLDQAEAACQDLDAALNAENWGLSKLETEKAEAHWQEWRCDAIHVNLEELEDASCCPGEAR